MSCTIEKIITDARMLVNRLKDHDSSVDTVISQATVLHNRVEAMKTYQEDLNELNEIARHRPRSALIMNLAQENSQIRELQQENRDLRVALEEHQSALELIMSKYREQVVKLVVANRLDRSSHAAISDDPQVVREKIDKISEMAAVMQRAIQADDDAVAREQEVIEQLKLENKTLRELLHVTVNSSRLCLNEQRDAEIQTGVDAGPKSKTASQTPSTDSKQDGAAVTSPNAKTSPSAEKTETATTNSVKDTENANKTSPPRVADDDSSKTGTVKKMDKKKDLGKK